MRKIRSLIASDIPFARDDANRLLPVMIACLTGFAALMLAVAMCLTHALSDQSRAVIGGIQVEVPRAKAVDDVLMKSVEETVKQAAGVEEVVILTNPQMEKLLKPWMGEDFTLTDLPVPVILDVKTRVEKGKSAVDLVALRGALTKLDSGIRVEDRGPWVGQMNRAMGLLQGLVILVALLLILCVLGMIMLVARTNLKLHFKTVSLLHMFGATDDYILRQFQWNNAWLAARGAVVGVLFAGLVFAASVILSMRWESPVVPQISVTVAHLAMFFLLPVFTALIALVATRLTVQSMLENMH